MPKGNACCCAVPVGGAAGQAVSGGEACCAAAGVGFAPMLIRVGVEVGGFCTATFGVGLGFGFGFAASAAAGVVGAAVASGVAVAS